MEDLDTQPDSDALPRSTPSIAKSLQTAGRIKIALPAVVGRTRALTDVDLPGTV